MKNKRFPFFLILILLSITGMTGQNSNPSVKKVHIIFKTHLDVGFTDLSSKVEQRYINDFIPKAIAVAEELRQSGAKERYVWTTGSWLIWSFLEQASAGQVKQLEDAIRHGDIVWNAVPYTVESEVMSKDHFETILKLSKYLDKRFGKETIAAKMTDVPGHTRSIVPLLKKAGIRFLHIGVNPASTIPNVPEISRWREKDGSEIILMYQKDYGSDIVLPDGETAMVVAFTGDNHGPHTAQKVKEIYSSIQQRYPNAELIASTLSAVAEDMESLKDQVPVITGEIGDTWIHGYGSSPVMMARFRALSRLYSRWIDEKRLDPDSEEALHFAVHLGLVAEHTWGLDVKSHLLHWDKYDYEAFQQARKLPEFERIELSWQEKENHVDKAIGYLPSALQIEAKKELAVIGNPAKQAIKGKINPKDITPNGALYIKRNGSYLVAGNLAYQAFSKEDFDCFQEAYLTQQVDWAFRDFGKPGLEDTGVQSVSVEGVLQNSDYKKDKTGTSIACNLAFPENSRIDRRVLPEEIYTNYKINPDDNSIDLSVTLINKPANRLPEAYWFSFLPEQMTQVIVEKTGRPVDVLDVVEGGNRQMHGVDRYVDILTSAGRFRITSLDAPLVAIGERNLLNYSTALPDIRQGIHFCLFNNVWGTNFRMWFEGSITYRFKIEFD
ncbi:MAG: DUF5054 domain-containing protein [Prevotella sp.]|nr:DUF5054 domain-containing protein [Prevotella sp.]